MNDDEIRSAINNVRAEVAKAVVGQEDVVQGILIGLLVGGHVLLEGVPGLAKTLLAKSIAAALELSFQRIQFTPDLMPSDVTGNLVYEANRAEFRFRPGPVFANLLLADELNRTPPKTQAALLEAMEERQVSVGGETHPLPDPFLLIATENPVEYEGTYPLPEAQLDRFLLQVVIGYPSRDQGIEVLRMHHAGADPHDLDARGIRPAAGSQDLEAARKAVVGITVSDDLLAYLVDLAEATRHAPSLSLGVSPRGAAMLLWASKAHAWLEGRDFATPDDVQGMLLPAWRHRVILRPEVEIEGGSPDTVLGGVLERIPVPR